MIVEEENTNKEDKECTIMLEWLEVGTKKTGRYRLVVVVVCEAREKKVEVAILSINIVLLYLNISILVLLLHNINAHTNVVSTITDHTTYHERVLRLC